MNSDDIKLSALLRQSRKAPPLPLRFQENVWRRIEISEAPAKAESWLDSLAALLLRPRFALATIAVLMAAGILLGAQQGYHTVKQDEEARYVALVAPDSLR